jgi:hypothetical protein
MPESRAAQMIREAFQSGRPLTYVHSPEEQRIATVLHEVSRGSLDSIPLPLWTWSVTEGLLRAGGSCVEREPRQGRRGACFDSPPWGWRALRTLSPPEMQSTGYPLDSPDPNLLCRPLFGFCAAD